MASCSAVERNEVHEPRRHVAFIKTGSVNGQGQSGQYSQRIIPGHAARHASAAPKFLGVNNERPADVRLHDATSAGCANGAHDRPERTPTRQSLATPTRASPSACTTTAPGASFDASWLWRGEFGGKTFNNTALVYSDEERRETGTQLPRVGAQRPDGISEPAKYSSRWIERPDVRAPAERDRRLHVHLPSRIVSGRTTRVYLSGDNLLLLTPYSGYDPEVIVDGIRHSPPAASITSTYPRARTFTLRRPRSVLIVIEQDFSSLAKRPTYERIFISIVAPGYSGAHCFWRPRCSLSQRLARISRRCRTTR